MNRNTIERAIWIIVTLLLLRLLPYEKLHDYSVFWISCVIAIPIYHYRINYQLFARRAIIATGCTQGGLAKRWLWRGTFLRIGNAIISIIIAYLIVISATFLVDGTKHANIQWLIILSASILLILLEAATSSFADRQAVGRFLPIFHRESIKRPVFLFVIVACATAFIFEPQENLTQLTPFDMAAGQLDASLDEYKESIDDYQSKLLGHSHGLISAFDQGTLYFAQNYIRRIEQTWAQWSLWIYLAIKSAAATGLIIYLLLGILTVVTEKQRAGWVVLGKSLFEKSFTFTLIFLFVLSIALGSIQIPLPQALPIAAVDCTTAIENFQQASLTRSRELEEDESRLQTEMSVLINDQLDSAFSVAELGVEEYLNWYYSVWGQYEPLLAKIITRLSDPAEALKEHVTGPIDNQLNQIQNNVNSKVLDELSQSSNSIRSQMVNETRNSDCSELPTLDFNIESMGLSMGLGQPQLAIATSALVAKVAAKKVIGKLAAKGAIKLTGKGLVAAGAGGFASGTICGPAVLICGSGASLLLWYGMDRADVEYTAAKNRENLKKEILMDLDQQKELLKTQLIAFNSGLISTGYDQINSTFSIREDGIQ